MIQEAYIQGISTRSVDDLAKAMGMSGVSKSQVSRLCEEIDERVHTSHAAIYNTFNIQRHLISRPTLRRFRAEAASAWAAAVA